MPATLAPHETVAVCDDVVMVRLLGEIEPHVRPAGRLSVRDTVPVKVPCEVTVTVDVPDAPALIVMLVAEIVKSAVAKVNVAGVE